MLKVLVTVLAFFTVLISTEDEFCAAGDATCQGNAPGKHSYLEFGKNWTIPIALFSNQFDEIDGHVMKVVRGNVPTTISGSLYRNGIGAYSLDGGRRVNNIIDGLSKLYCYNFDKGTVRMTAKFQRSDLYNRSVAAGTLLPSQHMGEMQPPLTKLEKMKLVMLDEPNDNFNIAMWDLVEGGGVTATTEVPRYIDVTRKRLDFLRKYHIVTENTKFYERPFLSASHFNRYGMAGVSYNYQLVFPKDNGLLSRLQPRYDVFRYTSSNPNTGVETKLIGSVPLDYNSVNIIHSLGVTENYVILPRFNMFLKMASPVDIGANIYWDARRPAVFNVISIKDGTVRSFNFNAAEGQHIINCFERRNDKGELEIVVDFPVRKYKVDYSEQMIYDYLNVDWLLDPAKSYANSELDPYGNCKLRRYIMNLDTGSNSERDLPVLWSPVEGSIVEFPIVNPHFRGRAYCHVFLHVWNKDLHNGMALLKINTCTGTSTKWVEHNKFPVEPIFIPVSPTGADDEGYVVGPVFDGDTGTSYLYVWDAQTMEVVVVLESPFIIPFGLHGVWLEE